MLTKMQKYFALNLCLREVRSNTALEPTSQK